MAELIKKLHFKQDAIEQTAKAYSTTTEAGTEYIENKIDGVICYVATGDTTDERAIIGRVKQINTAVERAILNSGKPPYTEKSWTTAGSYTFTVPQSITRIRVAVIGGGAGATVCGEDDDDSHSYTGYSGGGSSFGDLLTATGGNGGSIVISAHYDGEDYSQTGSGSGGTGGTPNGNNGNYTVKYTWQYSHTSTGGSGFELSFTKTLKSGGYGNGGYATVVNGTGVTVNAAGGSGGYNTGYVTVTPGSTYSITVGAGGAYRVDYFEGKSHTGYASKSGAVLIAFGGDI